MKDFILMCFGNTVNTKEIQFLSFPRKIRLFWKKFLCHKLPDMMKPHVKFASFFINKKSLGNAGFLPKSNIPFYMMKYNLIRVYAFTDELILWHLHIVVMCCFLTATSQRNSSKKNTRNVNLSNDKQPRVKAIK